MAYFWLRQDWLADGFMELEGQMPDGIYFHTGRVLNFQPAGPIPFTTTPAGHPAPSVDRFPPQFENGSVPAMSDLFYKAVIGAGIDNLQVWPAYVRNPTSGRIWRDYLVFNVIGLLDAVDLDASTGTEIMEGETGSGNVPALVDLKTIVLKQGIPQDLGMFRESTGGNLIVSHRVIQALKRTRPDEGWGIVAEELDQ